MTETNIKHVISNFSSAFPGLGATCHAVLAVAASTRLIRQHPLAVVLVGDPSSGKTTVLMPILQGSPDSQLKLEALRLDNFTPASLVSHLAGASEDSLKKKDLLPKMKGKVVVVKEMAPLFAGNEDQLASKFSTLAAVLDGEGLVTGTGAHGLRGYEEKITFSLLGAVTHQVLGPKVFTALASIGPRLCFWVVPDRYIDQTTWRGPNTESEAQQAQACSGITKFLEELYCRHGVSSISLSEFDVKGQYAAYLAAIAQLLAVIRSNLQREKDDFGEIFEECAQESPERAYRYLFQFVAGSALLEERRAVNEKDLALALWLALSSGTKIKRKILTTFFQSEAHRSVQDIYVRARISDETARKYLKTMEKQKLIIQTQYDGTQTWNLAVPFSEMRTALLKDFWQITSQPESTEFTTLTNWESDQFCMKANSLIGEAENKSKTLSEQTLFDVPTPKETHVTIEVPQ